MKNLFVPYNIAKRLCQMCFDEKCLAYYRINDGDEHELVYEIFRNSDELLNRREFIAAPLWQQVTAWLRNTKKINVAVSFRPNVKKWDSFYYDMNMNGKEYVKERSSEKYKNQPIFDTYEEALESAIIDYVNFAKSDK